MREYMPVTGKYWRIKDTIYHRMEVCQASQVKHRKAGDSRQAEAQAEAVKELRIVFDFVRRLEENEEKRREAS